jgi:hypothetical protein
MSHRERVLATGCVSRAVATFLCPLDVVETGRAALVRRREAWDRVGEFGAARAISSTARRHGILLMTWRHALRPERIGPDVQQTGFVRAVVAGRDNGGGTRRARAAAW